MSHPKVCTTWLRFLILPIVAGLLLTTHNGCATLDQIVRKPSAVFRNVQLVDASLVQSTAIFYFDVTNPNPVGIPVHRINYDLQLNGKPFVNGVLDKGLSLAAGGTSRMSIPVTMQYLDFFQSASQLWRNKHADYFFKGNFAVGPVVVPFQAKGRFNLPEMPKINLEAIEIKKYSLFGATLNCRLKMDNPNAFNLLFKRLNYELKLGGKRFAKASALSKGPIEKNSRSTIDLGFDVSFSQLGRSAYQLLQGGKADYTLDGGLVFDSPGAGERQVPFNLSGRVPFLR